MTNKLYISFFLVILLIAGTCGFSFSGGPPPGNDGICDARSLAVDGTCLPGQTNVDATGDIYGGCVNSNYPSVWYTFSLTGSNNAVDITFTGGTFGGDGVVNTFLLSGTCASPGGISTVCENWTSTFEFTNLSTGVTYFFEVATQSGANQGNFNICATQKLNVGAKTGPEQDCEGAIPVCASTYIMSGAYTGFGDKQEVNTGSCMKSGETNSVWFIFTAQTAGALDFLITTTKDYDFAVYDITTIGCAGVPSAIPERCNWSGTLGNTGLVDAPNTTKIPKLSQDGMGTPTMAGISNMAAGETYVLVVDNWTGDNTGFTLDFGASPIIDVTAPTIVNAVPSCTANTILIQMSEDIKCLSVIPTGFTLQNITTGAWFTTAMTNIVGYNCPITDDALTDQIQITHNGTLTSGNYTITFNPPTPNDKCGNPVAGGSTVSFDYLAPIVVTSDKPNDVICSSTPVILTTTLSPDGTPDPVIIYTLNPGAVSNGTGIFTVTPTSTTLYTVSAVFGTSCTRTATKTITLENNVVISINPVDPQICTGGNVNLTATTTINGVSCTDCNYTWTTVGGSCTQIFPYSQTGVASSTITTCVAGTYNVQATTAAGCVSNTASSTVSLASGSPTTCNVYYVTNGGCAIAGCGTTKGNPASLAYAISQANCTNSIIKMATGVYPLTDRQIVTSYLTIEGGYATDFLTKSSNMSGGASSTTIQRSNAADSDDANGCTAFRVGNSSTGFRFQDLRIEMPGSPTVAGHAAGSNKTNYGIRMGTGCTAYSVVRCYIHMGQGSEP